MTLNDDEDHSHYLIDRGDVYIPVDTAWSAFQSPSCWNMLNKKIQFLIESLFNFQNRSMKEE